VEYRNSPLKLSHHNIELYHRTGMVDNNAMQAAEVCGSFRGLRLACETDTGNGNIPAPSHRRGENAGRTQKSPDFSGQPMGYLTD